MNETTETVINIETPAPPEAPKRADLRKDRTEEGRRIPEPFTQIDLADRLGMTKGGAQSQLRRWIYWGWAKNVEYGKYVRTGSFGGEKLNIGYDPTHRKSQSRAGGIEIPCDFEGCSFVAHGIDRRNAKGSLGRHKAREHGMKKMYVPVAMREKYGISPSTKSAIMPSNGVAPAPAPESEAVSLNYCPSCGLNLQMHQLSYRIARKHRKE